MKFKNQNNIKKRVKIQNTFISKNNNRRNQSNNISNRYNNKYWSLNRKQKINKVIKMIIKN